MPAKDRTGPEGEGARTGRAAGDCNDAVESKMPSDGARGGFGRGGGRRGSNRGQGQGGRMGRRRGFGAAASDGQCVCTNCGHKIAHVAGQPCSQQVCPSCNARMTRA
ncbi:MAG: DUF5320 domain-containing protein [Anaerolineales bacterium]